MITRRMIDKLADWMNAPEKHGPDRRWCVRCSIFCLAIGLNMLWGAFILIVSAFWKPVQAYAAFEKVGRSLTSEQIALMDEARRQ